MKTEYRYIRLSVCLAMVCLCQLMSFAETRSKGGVTITYTTNADGTIYLRKVVNHNSYGIDLYYDDNKTELPKNRETPISCKVKNEVRFKSNRESYKSLWKFRPVQSENLARNEARPVIEPETPKTAAQPQAQPSASASVQEAVQPEKGAEDRSSVHDAKDRTVRERESKELAAVAQAVEKQYGGGSYSRMVERLDGDGYFGRDAVRAFVAMADSLAAAFAASDDKAAFLADNGLQAFIDDYENELESRRALVSSLASEIVASAGIGGEAVTGSVEDILNNRLKQREEALRRLETAVQGAEETTAAPSFGLNGDMVNYVIVGTVLLIVMILTVLAFRMRKKQSVPKAGSQGNGQKHNAPDANPAIVVRRRTTSILKRQSLEDVVGNPAYMEIDAAEFTDDSAVRTIYVKNTCIREVYDMYAEDLRNTDNPKEDGCMVLGRWVLDEATKTYDVSLEEVVFPGEDAVFKEYELNFGGKIKLRIAEKLRKLRKDTNLQYDLVCWIHSHPGLGVFFSNSDDNVQMQLRHAQHPRFLTAFVIDILTSAQETGIFTFRKDGTMNSKNDLKRLYSLEEMYKWALESCRKSFSPENYYDVLGNSALKTPSCRKIGLDNSAVIDLAQIAVEEQSGLVGWVVGSSNDAGNGREFVVSRMTRADGRPASGIVGCLISVAHLSLPTIQRLIGRQGLGLSFVMVYSSRQMTLTSIPVVDGEVMTDERYYGDVNIDDLKIWTRRKR